MPFTIQDVNEFTPSCSPTFTRGLITENTAQGTAIADAGSGQNVVLTATDGDRGSMGIASYTLRTSSGSPNTFTFDFVNSTTFFVVTASTLDREAFSSR